MHWTSEFSVTLTFCQTCRSVPPWESAVPDFAPDRPAHRRILAATATRRRRSASKPIGDRRQIARNDSSWSPSNRTGNCAYFCRLSPAILRPFHRNFTGHSRRYAGGYARLCEQAPDSRGKHARRILPMKSVSRISLAKLLTGSFAVALLATPARGDVIMDWNAKADAIAIEKQIRTPPTPAARRCSMSRCSRRSTPSTGDTHLTSSTLRRTVARHAKRLRRPRRMTSCGALSRPEARPRCDARGVARRRLPSRTRNRRGSNSAGRPPPGSSRCAPMTAPTRRRAIVRVTAPGVYVPTAMPIESTSCKDDTLGHEHRLAIPPAPPPALNSEVWTRDLNEIREIGSSTSTRRSAEQTTTARFWFFTGPRTYNPIVKQVATGQKDGYRGLRSALCADFDRRRRCLHRGIRRPNIPIISGAR